MGLKPDWWIANQTDMIRPFVDHKVSSGVISYGLSSYGYDIRVGEDFKIFYKDETTIIDPKDFRVKPLDFRGSLCIIPPNSFALASSIEYFKMPNNVMGVVLGKSTYARCGIVTNFTPLEPGWEGHITIEISNTSPIPAKIYANEGIAQVLFFEGDAHCDFPYIGNYQFQNGITLPKV